MRRLPALLLLSIVTLLAACAATQEVSPTPPNIATATNPPGDTVEVAHVFDGDSLEAVLADGSRIEVRLIGINAPEGDECFGNDARSTLEDWLEGTAITLVADDEESDQFGRILRYIYVDGVNLNLAMLESGSATALQTGHSLDSIFADSSDTAAASGLGMWATDACGSSTPPALEIVDYVFDPPGRDSDNPNGEWVAIANETPAGVAMAGWSLRDESTQHRFRFPNGFFLQAGEEVVVHSGCGTDTASDLYWCASDPVWSNGGDTVILQLADGTVVARKRYAGD